MLGPSRLVLSFATAVLVAVTGGAAAYAAHHHPTRTAVAQKSVVLERGEADGHSWVMSLYGPNGDTDWCWQVTVDGSADAGCGLERRNPYDGTSGPTNSAILDDTYDIEYGYAPAEAARAVLLAPVAADTTSETDSNGVVSVAAAGAPSAGASRHVLLHPLPTGTPDGQYFVQIVPRGSWITRYYDAGGNEIGPYGR